MMRLFFVIQYILLIRVYEFMPAASNYFNRGPHIQVNPARFTASDKVMTGL